MDQLVFDCVGVRVERYAVTPSMTLELRITETSGVRIDAIALRCQIRVEPHRRRYSAEEAESLHDLFGSPDRWADTLKPMQLANLSVMVPGFTGSATVDLLLPLTYDMEIATTKYFNGLTDGTIPLLLLFSGTVFSSSTGKLQVQQVPWSKETSYPLPVKAWRESIDVHFPNSAWLKVHRETLDSLRRYKTRHALPTWESALIALLDRSPS
ncbi:DUF6084 family protein [Kibdelosporangium philippinense]|uniref:DUF6084 family protein n=1 Tax=Kibdelosporangium philippinense TaxID=211113 RepID=A0ABS8ZH88_9PSEU|nr:DUF6084 family protein [Kibdelosporangium philippinense]MCE7006847.1 DUF6084 family protein [Kibdelosporangium philippinense]